MQDCLLIGTYDMEPMLDSKDEISNQALLIILDEFLTWLQRR